MDQPLPSPPTPPAAPPADPGTPLYCPSCGYDVRHTVDPRCPECGKPFDRATLTTSRIPWVHRKRIGRVKAFVSTILLVFRQPSAVAAEVDHPVRWPDASRFRWASLGISTLVLATAMGGVYPWFPLDFFHFDFGGAKPLPPPSTYPLLALLTGPGIIGVVAAAWFFGGAAAVWVLRAEVYSVGSPVCARLAALACYLTAWLLPASLLTSTYIVLWACRLRDIVSERQHGEIQKIVGMACCLAGLTAICELFLFLRRGNAPVVRAVAISLTVPSVAVVSFVLVMPVIVYLMGLAALCFDSLRP